MARKLNQSTTKDSSVSPFPGASDSSVPTPSRVLQALGIEGLGAVEPVILAALVTREPLLLIGPHGTGKSLLLTRVGEALGLSIRHYNASLLNFDDLVGFPVPTADGSLHYVRTPASIWDAGAVIFDEVSRCRPDIQNKLFPIIHERRVQGLLLDSLRYRWAAMNPPATDDATADYLGSLPLDAALADRFGYIVTMPPWDALTEAEQLRIIRSNPGAIPRHAADSLRTTLDLIESILDRVSGQLGDGRALYVRSLVALCAQAGLSLSPRRAAMLHRAIAAIHASRVALDPGALPDDSAWLAVSYGIPQRAEGKPVPAGKLWAAHKEATRLANLQPGDPLAEALLTHDPLQRIKRALHSSLSRVELSTLVADALAQLRPGQRDAVVVYLFKTGLAGRLTAAIAEQCAERYQHIEDPIRLSEVIHAGHPRYRVWQTIKNLLSRLDPHVPQAHRVANGIAAAFHRKELESDADVQTAFEDIPQTEALLFGGSV
jgi:MoxR-like ATPase